MNKEKLKVIMKELEKEKKCVYPFLELTEEEMEYLKLRGVVINYEFIELPHLLIDGTYKKLATVLELKDQLKENTYRIRGTVNGFSVITTNKTQVNKDRAINCKDDLIKLLEEMSEEEEKEFIEIFVKLAKKHG